MKLYLSSYRVPTPKDLEALLPRQIKGARVAIITNAKDYKQNAPERKFKLNNLKDFLQDIGFKAKFFDLRDYSNADELETGLAGYDLIWAAGGNTFVLMHEIKRSGFDKAIKNLLKKGIVYGGESAGAVVAGTSLRGIELADDPGEATGVIWDGMGLIDRVIVPHADNIEFQDSIVKVIEMHRSSGKLAVLKDNQALFVDRDNIKLVQPRIH